MPTQLYAVQQQKPQNLQNLERLRHDLKAELLGLVVTEVQQTTASIIPVLRNELRSEIQSEIQSLEQRLGAQLALACKAFENLEQRTNELHGRLQAQEKHETHTGKKNAPPSDLPRPCPLRQRRAPAGITNQPRRRSAGLVGGGGAADLV